MILRIVASNGAARSTTRGGGSWADVGIAVGSWLPAILWGVAFAILVRGLPIDADKQMHLSFSDVLNPYTLLGGLATASLFAFYGAVFLALKTAGAVRDDAFRFARILRGPGHRDGGGFGLWTQLAHGKGWTWLALGVAVVALLAAVALLWTGRREGWAFVPTVVVVAAVVMLLFGSMYPNLVPSTLNPEWSLTIYNASSTPYTLKIMTWASLTLLPLVIAYQAWTYWVFRHRISAERDTRVHRAVDGDSTRDLDPRPWRPGDAPLPDRLGVLRCGDQRRAPSRPPSCWRTSSPASSPTRPRARWRTGRGRCGFCWRCGSSRTVATGCRPGWPARRDGGHRRPGRRGAAHGHRAAAA